jgi:hypothetical protein
LNRIECVPTQFPNGQPKESAGIMTEQTYRAVQITTRHFRIGGAAGDESKRGRPPFRRSDGGYAEVMIPKQRVLNRRVRSHLIRFMSQ